MSFPTRRRLPLVFMAADGLAMLVYVVLTATTWG